MRYRPVTSEKWQCSVLGFGCMRLPVFDNVKDIDEEQATSMLRYAIQNGINYIDTAYPYHGGNSEVFLGKALKDGLRNKVKLVTKMPSWLINSEKDFDQYFNEQLERLQTDYIDIYLLHAMNRNRFALLKSLNVFEWLEKAKKNGKIRSIGFSFHDDYDAFIEIVDAYPWDVCQIQYNLMDVNANPGKAGLEYAHAKGLSVIVMEPLRGGDLTRVIPPAIQDLWDQMPTKKSPAYYALQWVWSHKEVSVVLSGMSNISQIMENIIYANDSEVGKLTSEENNIIDKIRQTYEIIKPLNCTKCGYCQPCPNEVNVPYLFDLYNEISIYGVYDKARFGYNFLPEENRPTHCDGCGRCLDLCPQQIKIPEMIQKIRAIFEEGKTIDELD